jgi:hypothetical protein
MRSALIGLLFAAACVGCNSDSTSVASGSAASPAPGAAPTPSPPTPAPDPHAQPPAGSPSPSPTPTPAPSTLDGVDAEKQTCYATGVPRRLTQTQYVNSVTDFARAMVNDGALTASVASIVNDTAQFPPDTPVNPSFERHEGYYRLDQSLNARHLSAIHTTATRLATEMTANSTRVNALLSSCPAGASTDACLTSFIQKAGRILFRKPLAQNEIDIYKNAAGNSSSASALSKVLATMLASPNFFIVVEKGQSGTSGDCAPLTAHELAARLALHFWNTVPDDALNRDADSGELLKPDVYASHVARMAADPRADAVMREFFRGWLRLDELVALDGRATDPKFKAFAGSFTPLATSRASAINEVLDMISYLAQTNGTLQQVLTDRRSFARTADIAGLYKVPVWDGSSTPPTFSEPERAGLLTRIAIIANGSSDTTLPIRRASRILGGLTCQTVPPPAMDQSNAKADLSGLLTTRERTERVTQMDGTSCPACHTNFLNPWGFVLEGFDALGRVRTTETIRDDAGNVLGKSMVNTSTLAKLENMDARSVGSAAQAQQYILDSGHFERCFGREYVRFTFGRADTDADLPLIKKLRNEAVAGKDLRSLFAAIALRQEFTAIKKNQ